MLRFKPDVRMRFLSGPLVDMLGGAAAWSLWSGVDVEINSVDDGAGVHQPDSLHGFSLAVDFDTVGDRAADLEQLAVYFRRTLPPAFDIVLEGDHVHVEWDARRGPLRRPT